MYRPGFSRLRQNAVFVVGLLFGVTLSLIIASITQNKCALRHSFEDYADDYEPRLNLAGKNSKAKKEPQPFTRPRYFSTELGTRDKLFIAVLSSQDSIKSHGVAVNKTVCHLVDKLMFFIDAPGTHKLNLSMPGIVGFTDSRKILKPFHVLKYIGDNYADDFDFYFLITDKAYINVYELNKLVQGIGVRDHVHAGGATEENQRAFCSIEAGVLLSNSALRKVHTNLDWCIKNAITNSDSTNIGRCILHATDIPCHSAVQGLELKSLKLKSSWSLPVRQDAYISVFPVRNPSDSYKLHDYFSTRRLVSLDTEIETLRSSIINTSYVSPGGRDGLVWPAGATDENRPVTRFDVLRWDYFTETHLYPESDFSNAKVLTRSDKEDTEHILKEVLKWIKKRYGGVLDFVKVKNGYRRFDPARGMDYRLDIAFRNTLTDHEVVKRLEVSKPLSRVEVVPFPYVTENTRVNMLVLVRANERDLVAKFLRQYSSVLMEKQDKTYLLLILLYDPTTPGKGHKDDVFSEIKKTAVNLTNQHKRDGGKVAWVSVKLPEQQIHWRHSLFDFGALDIAVRKLPADGLVFLCRPNVELRQDLINRVRMNTIRSMQVFSPVPFQEYNPDVVYNTDLSEPELLDINKSYGHYDSWNTGFISFYAVDYITARETTKDKLPIVSSDKDITKLLVPASVPLSNPADLLSHLAANTLYSLFIRASNLHVLRAIEPSLRLRYLFTSCNETGSISSHCFESQVHNLGSRSALARLLLEYQTSRQILSYKN